MVNNTEHGVISTATRRAPPTTREMPQFWRVTRRKAVGQQVRENFLLHMKIRYRKCRYLNFSDRNIHHAKLDPYFKQHKLSCLQSLFTTNNHSTTDALFQPPKSFNYLKTVLLKINVDKLLISLLHFLQ
jgi:hypothetical protein